MASTCRDQSVDMFYLLNYQKLSSTYVRVHTHQSTDGHLETLENTPNNNGSSAANPPLIFFSNKVDVMNHDEEINLKASFYTVYTLPRL